MATKDISTNVTSDEVHVSAAYTLPTTIVIRSIGSVTFILNMLALIYIIRLWKTQKKENSFQIQMAFVCANDVGCGIVIILMSIPVYDVITVYVCGFSHIVLNTLVCMSLGNIFFICLQRYIFARNIRATTVKWKSILSRTLLVVNLTIGIVVFSVNIINTEFYIVYRGKECSLGVFKNFGHQTLLLLFFIGVPSILASDILCCLAIMKLSRSATIHVTTSECITTQICEQDDLPGSREFKKYQHRAIITVILILVASNLSTIPNFLCTFLGFVNVFPSVAVGRLLLFCIFGNSLANPIIYVTRMQSLRLMVNGDLVKIKECFSRR